MGAINRDRINQIAIFLIALVCYAYFFPRWADPNQNSRLNMVVAVVDDGTFQIDKYVANTVDYAKVNGHYYSDKAPGVAFLGIPLYASLRAALNLPALERLTDRLANSEAFQATLRESGSGVLADKVRFALAQVVLSFLTNAVPTALLCVLIYRLLGRFGAGQNSRIFVALAYGLLTPAFAYANAFYGHQLSAFLLFAAFYLLFPFDPSQNPGDAKPEPSAARTLSVGLLLGYSVVTEFPAALTAGVLTLYAFYVLRRAGALTKVVPMVAGLAVCAAGLMLYNTTVFGGPFKLGYSNSELWTAQHSAGFMSLTLPGWEAASGITFSLFRGLFVLSPVLLLAVAGFVLWWRSGRFRAAFWVALLSTLSMFLFNASSIMWWGGFSIGPRYVLPGLPFMALAIAFAIDPATVRDAHLNPAQPRRSAWLVGLIVVLSIWSFAATWGMTLAEQAFPSDAFRTNPFVEHALPNWQSGNIARSLGTIAGFRGVAALMPLAALIVVFGAVWWVVGSRTTGSSQPSRAPSSAQADRLPDPARPVTDSTL